jgi:oligogalacturonide lyase
MPACSVSWGFPAEISGGPPYSSLTEGLKEGVLRCPGCSHSSSDTSGREIVRDSRTDPFIHLVDVHARRETALCRHDSSWKWYGEDSQAAHPHPSFSPDSSRVIFSSDKDGQPATYLVKTTAVQ